MSKPNRVDFRRIAHKEQRRQREVRRERHFEDLQRFNLCEFEGKTMPFTVRIERRGRTKFGNMEDTILLKDIRTPEGRKLCDHLWVKKAHVASSSIPPNGTKAIIKAHVYRYVTERRGAIYREKFSFKDIVFM